VPQNADLTEPFQLLAGDIALDFVNTLDNRFDPAGPLELLVSYDRLLAFCRQAGSLDAVNAARLARDTGAGAAARTLERAIGLREALYSLFASVLHHTAPPADALEALNKVLRATHPPRVVTWNSPHFAWQMEAGDPDPQAILWPIARAAADLLTSTTSAHLSECGAESCRWLFLDRSRNHSRRWCDMKTCGNRNKARRFQARRPAPRRGPA
jgi:predicted RNA-binding Zn ribbon-like protein